MNDPARFAYAGGVVWDRVRDARVPRIGRRPKRAGLEAHLEVWIPGKGPVRIVVYRLPSGVLGWWSRGAR